ncbi:hypothetical protein SRHO_G00062860 [Serrasalmus rhombeus]
MYVSVLTAGTAALLFTVWKLIVHLSAQRHRQTHLGGGQSTAMVILNSSEVIREALVKKWSDFAGRPPSYTGDKVSGGGWSISLGDYSKGWKAHRRITHSALHRCTADSLHSVIEKQALHLKQVLLDYRERPVDLSEDFTVAASNVITTLAFGKSRLPNPPFSRLMKEVARRDELIRGHLDEVKTLTDTQMHMTTVDLLIGGTETTAAWLSWTVAFLLHRPEVQTAVYEELFSVLKGQYPQYSDRHRLPYLRALINEMLRLRPVAPLAVPHKAKRNSSIAGYFIPENTVVIPNLFGAHHDPEVWTDPYSFRPERFLEGGGGSLRALMPFGGGARLCLGETIAKVELFLFTAYLLRDFQFLPESPEELPDLRGVATVVLKTKPYRVIVRPRAQ